MVVAQAAEIEALRAVLKTMKAMIFGARSEKMAVILDAQLPLNLGDLCTDVPITAANDDDASSPVVTLHRRKKAKRNVGHLPKHLPRIVSGASTPLCMTSLRFASARFDVTRSVGFLS